MLIQSSIFISKGLSLTLKSNMVEFFSCKMTINELICSNISTRYAIMTIESLQVYSCFKSSSPYFSKKIINSSFKLNIRFSTLPFESHRTSVYLVSIFLQLYYIYQFILMYRLFYFYIFYIHFFYCYI